ncbi:MAG: amidase [Pirellulales bacterium]|nr:amidase [Pirellulales bacterium]
MISRRAFLRTAGMATGVTFLGASRLGNAIAHPPMDQTNRWIHPPTDAICLLPATEMASLIRTGKLSPVDLLEMHIERIKRLEPFINAVTYLDELRALRRARAAVKAIAEDRVNWDRQPLFGVPFSVKNSLDVKGIQVACGCPTLKYNIATKDAFVVAQMKKAGANFLAATNLPFFSVITETDSGLHGITKNPYNLDRTPGGSSGGEAALIAIGCSPMGIGTDAGGSIRFPSAWCGLAGLCPAPRRVSHRGHFTAFNWGRAGIDEPAFMTVGPMARTVRDLECMLPIIATPDGKEPITVVDTPVGKPWNVPANRIRVAYFTKWRDDRAKPTGEVQDAVESSAQALARRGCDVQMQRPTFFDETIDIGDAFCLKEVTPEMLREASNQFGGQGNVAFERMIAWWGGLKTRMGNTATKWRNRYPAWREKYLKFMSEVDVLLTPVYPTPAPKHGQAFVSKAAGDDTTWAYLVNNVDVVPGGTVRIATSREESSLGLPIGIQVLGSPFGEHKVLRIMRELEDEFGGYQPPSDFLPDSQR